MDKETGAQVYSPDVIAKWEYSKEEWKLMSREETNRRLKEGIWVSLLIGALGGWLLTLRNETFFFGFLFSLCAGIIISILKVVVSNNLFSSKANNTIVIVTDALIINGKFKPLSNEFIYLEYVKALKIGSHQFIEFSLQWMTKRGDTNDQFRILVPKRHENEVQKVLDYYAAKGVTTTKE